jgi:thioredoxin reductase (NADPH)
MAKPVILSVDDDPEVLGAIERDLRQHYRATYRVVTTNSGRGAIDAARQLKQRGTPVALFLADERMPEMTGTETLRELRKLYPDARKVLLTAYADTQAAITGINDVGLDHYLMKPWDPPEDRLFPVLDDLLTDWSAHVKLPYEGIRVVGSRWSPACYAAKEFLSRNQVPYQWIEIEDDPSIRTLVDSIAGTDPKLPVVLFPDGTALVGPSNIELANKVGLKTRAARPFYDLVVIGGGPAGLANSVYAASEGLRILMVEQSAPGGQAGTSSMIENYLGFPAGVTGADLAQRATAQARKFGAELLTAQKVVCMRREDPYRIVQLSDGSEVSCYTAVIATGLEVRRLEAQGIDRHLGAGVYYGAAMTEGATYRGQDICIVGGANSAGQGALFFSRYARKITMLIRSAALSPGMSRYLVDRIAAIPNIEVISRVEITAAHGDTRLERITLRNVDDGSERDLDTSAIFIFIGTAPRTEAFADFVFRDEKGFILTGADLPRDNGRVRGWTLDRDPLMFETNVPGVFAAGDVRSGANRRVAAAVGEGSAAIYSVHRYLMTV